MVKSTDIIIIGGGVAGLTAAIYSCRAGMRVSVVESMFTGGQVALSGIIENYPGFANIDGGELALAVSNQAERLGADIVYSSIQKVELNGVVKSVYLQNGDVLEAKSIIIATGASPRKLGIDTEEKFVGRGVSYCATCDGALYKGKDVAIVGGGNSAVEEAVYLSKFAKEVYIIHRRADFRAVSAEIAKMDNTANIHKVINSQVIEIVGDKKVTSINVRNIVDNCVHNMAVEGLFVAIGRIPETALFEGQVNLDTDGYIIAGEDTVTNLDKVFVVGDVRTKSLRQIVTAVADGAVAGNSAAKAINESIN